MHLERDDLEVRLTEHKGRGVFARIPIRRGALVTPLEGTVASTSDLPDDCLALQIGEDLWLYSDGTSLDDCINHSCEPNLGFAAGDLNLFALRDIEPGEELVWDYSTSIAVEGWSLDCRCGTASCRQTAFPWHELSEAERTRLEPIALGYLRRPAERSVPVASVRVVE